MGLDEIGEKDDEIQDVSAGTTSSIDPLETLVSKVREKGYTFEDIKTKLVKLPEKYPGAEAYKGFEDIPLDKILGILEALNKVKVKN